MHLTRKNTKLSDWIQANVVRCPEVGFDTSGCCWLLALLKCMNKKGSLSEREAACPKEPFMPWKREQHTTCGSHGHGQRSIPHGNATRLWLLLFFGLVKKRASRTIGPSGGLQEVSFGHKDRCAMDQLQGPTTHILPLF